MAVCAPSNRTPDGADRTERFETRIEAVGMLSAFRITPPGAVTQIEDSSSLIKLLPRGVKHKPTLLEAHETGGTEGHVRQVSCCAGRQERSTTPWASCAWICRTWRPGGAASELRKISFPRLAADGSVTTVPRGPSPSRAARMVPILMRPENQHACDVQGAPIGSK